MRIRHNLNHISFFLYLYIFIRQYNYLDCFFRIGGGSSKVLPSYALDLQQVSERLIKIVKQSYLNSATCYNP
jgi:hypothetical protein